MSVEPMASGRYFNAATQQYEIWAVNQYTGERRLLGTYSKMLAELEPAAFTDWEQRVWRRWLFA